MSNIKSPHLRTGKRRDRVGEGGGLLPRPWIRANVLAHSFRVAPAGTTTETGALSF